jgi:putative restriction endonuclease
MDNIFLDVEKRKEYSESNYIRKADPENNYWFDFSADKLEKDYLKKYGNNFNLIIAGNENQPGDYFIIPFEDVQHIFNEKHISHDKGSRSTRWVGTIKNNRLKVSNCEIVLDCSMYYGNKKIIDDTLSEDEENDYAIENKLREVKIRLKQSVFRKKVLNNFSNSCCISNITEVDLLRASHIIPWSENIETRLDPSNGLSLSILYDGLFDQGYFSLSDNLEILVENNTNNYSEELKNILQNIKGSTISKPIKYEIKKEYLTYHRENVWKGKNGG